MRKTAISIFKSLYKSEDVPFIVTLEKCLERIRQGSSKDLIDKIRQGDGDLKKKLPCIIFSGTFRERNSKSLQKHSGLMILDFDNFPSQKVMSEMRETLIENPHIVSVFTSPSGNGLKAVVRVNNNLDKETHPRVFKAFQKEYDYEYFDKSNSNVDRICFDSYDPDIYINYDAKIFDPVIEDEGYRHAERVPILPVTNEDIIIERIMKWNWTKDFKEGERNEFIFNIASAFCEYGVTEPAAKGYINNNVVIGDFTEREANATIASAYRTRKFGIKYFEDYKKIERVKLDLKNGKKFVIDNHDIDEKTYNEVKKDDEHEDFWYWEETKKNEKVKIDNLAYKKFLERHGFKKYFPNDSQKPTWVRVESNIVSETSVEKIKDFVLNYLLDRGEVEVWKLCTNYGNLFSEQFLLMLDSIELDMLRDEKERSFIAYKNGILEVTKNEAKLTEYVDIDRYVWNSQIIQRDFVPLDDHTNEYEKFISNITDGRPLPMECAIGYLLSSYKNKMNNKAIILNDEVISDNPEGGTGKGLLVQGLRQIRNVSILDGKSFDDKKSFPYQTVSQDTHILVFDDVKKNFDFESKFSLVTEGITLERKNKDAIKLTVEDSPKMVISTNYAIKGEGNSHDRRRHELEVAQFYGRRLTPYDEFGRQLFDDWSVEDFQKFDNYMVHCIQMYLKNGLIEQEAKNLKMRKLVAETSMEFVEWIEDSNNFPINIRHSKSETYTLFINEYKDFQKWLSRKRFNVWIQKYANFMEADYVEGKSNGDRWHMIKTDSELVIEDELDEIAF